MAQVVWPLDINIEQNGVPELWFWPGPALAGVIVQELDQWTEDLFPSSTQL